MDPYLYELIWISAYCISSVWIGSYHRSLYEYAIYITRDKIKSNFLVYAISSFHKLSWRIFGNKVKTVYEHVISCFYKFSANNLIMCDVLELEFGSGALLFLVKGVFWCLFLLPLGFLFKQFGCFCWATIRVWLITWYA